MVTAGQSVESVVVLVVLLLVVLMMLMLVLVVGVAAPEARAVMAEADVTLAGSHR